jgi:hypothetical protein
VVPGTEPCEATTEPRSGTALRVGRTAAATRTAATAANAVLLRLGRVKRRDGAGFGGASVEFMPRIRRSRPKRHGVDNGRLRGDTGVAMYQDIGARLME